MVGLLDPQLRGTRLDARMVREYLDSGAWKQHPLSTYLHDAAAAAPARAAVVTGVGESRHALSYRELADLVGRVRDGLADLGVRPGDVVTVMLPNSAEFVALIWAITELGAVYSGIPTAYGRREATMMAARTMSKVLVVPDVHRDRDFIGLADDVCAGAPSVRAVVVLGQAPAGPKWTSFAELTNRTAAPLPNQPAAGRLAHLGFTSGTTGEAKAVMNTHQTLDAVLRNWVAHVGSANLGEPPVNLVCSPIGHHTGFLWGVLLSAYLSGTAVCMDRWDPAAAVGLIRQEGVTMMVAAPTFLQDLVRVPGADREQLDSLRLISIPGAPIPRALVSAARDELGCFICPAWGMTEYGIGISAAPSHPRDRVEATDGVPVPGCQVRIVDPATRAPLPAGQLGALEIAGAGLFLGYLDRPDATAEAIVDNWFATGDLATMSENGYVTLRGRTKDIIIRGGENIPAIEVEDMLHRHPDVLDVAVVGLPDDRLGERACAVLVTAAGIELGLPDVTGFLLDQGLSKHFLPERVELVDALPKTMSGKIRKVELRQRFGG